MKELDVEPIVAHSPQAKGRIENLFKTLQDRLIKEMRLRNISDMDRGNQFLKEEFIPWFNQKYGKELARKANLHRRLTQAEKKQLPAILSRHSQRTVQNDFTIRFNNKWYQLTKEQPATVILLTKPQKQTKQPWVIAASQKKERKSYKPPADHPWRRFTINSKPDISISSLQLNCECKR